MTPNTSGSLAWTRNTLAAAEHSLFIGNQIQRPHTLGGHAIVECRSMTSIYAEHIEKRNRLQKTNHPGMPTCTSCRSTPAGGRRRPAQQEAFRAMLLPIKFSVRL
jgi:hypothetical protein